MSILSKKSRCPNVANITLNWINTFSFDSALMKYNSVNAQRFILFLYFQNTCHKWTTIIFLAALVIILRLPRNRPLSRRLDRCDRVIQDEVGDSNGGGGAMCKTSQCELRSLRVNSGMLNVIRIVTYYTLPPLESSDSF